jgi:hypothetical protein
LVKDGLALEFLLEVMVTWKAEKGLQSLVTALKRGGLDGRLHEYFPSNKRGDEVFRSTFDEKGLVEVVKLHKAQVNKAFQLFYKHKTFALGYMFIIFN